MCHRGVVASLRERRRVAGLTSSRLRFAVEVDDLDLTGLRELHVTAYAMSLSSCIVSLSLSSTRGGGPLERSGRRFADRSR